MTGFASDNTAGAHPRVLEAIAQASVGHADAYGDDAWTEQAVAMLRARFGADSVPFLVTTGTAANVLALDQLTMRHEAVVCAASAHIVVDECGAPERYAGVRLLVVPTTHGKLNPDDVQVGAEGVGDVHRVQPGLVSASESTELGTVYTVAELAALADATHAAGMLLHVDGARLANAAAALGVTVRALTRDVGVDVVTVGFTKAGAMLAEAVVFLRPGLAESFAYGRKQGLQMVSKMRFLSAQVVALLEDDLWLDLARNANAMGRRLAEAVGEQVEIVHPVEANAVFVRVEAAAIPALRAAGAYTPWDGDVVRWMTAWDTTPSEVDAFAERVRLALG